MSIFRGLARAGFYTGAATAVGVTFYGECLVQPYILDSALPTALKYPLSAVAGVLGALSIGAQAVVVEEVGKTK